MDADDEVCEAAIDLFLGIAELKEVGSEKTMKVICVTLDSLGQNDVLPTEADFLVNDDWQFYGCDGNKFVKFSSDGVNAIEDKGGTDYLFIDMEGGSAWQTSDAPDEEQLIDVEMEMLIVVKFEDEKFFAVDEDGDWVKVGKVEMGNASCGDYHIFM